MITQIEPRNKDVEFTLNGIYWMYVPDRIRESVANAMQLSHESWEGRFFSRMIVDQQQSINLALRDSVNDFGQFRRSMFL